MGNGSLVGALDGTVVVLIDERVRLRSVCTQLQGQCKDKSDNNKESDSDKY